MATAAQRSLLAIRRKLLDVSAGAIHLLRWQKPTAVAKVLGDNIDKPILPLLHFAGGEEQQFNRDPMIGKLPTQGIRFHKPRMAGQPGIGHGDQQIKIRTRLSGAVVTGPEQQHLGAGNGRLDFGRDRAQQRLIHYVVIVGAAG